VADRPGRLRIAVIGGGAMGARHLRKLAELPGVAVAGLVDPDPATAPVADMASVRRFDNLDELLAATGADAAIVATPTPEHHDVAAVALSAGLHVLVEKPIAATLDEADALIAAAERAGVVLAVGHVERHNPVVQELRRLVADGTVGDVSSVLARRVGGVPQREPATDVVVDLAIHDVDVMGYVTGQTPVLLAAHGSRTFHGSRHDSAEILLRLGRASGFIQVNWVTPTKVRTLTVTGSHGVAEANYLTQELRLLETVWIEDAADFAVFVNAFGHPRELNLPVANQEPLWNELTAFVHDVRQGTLSESVSAADARAALAVALAASEALPEGESELPGAGSRTQ
jgi:UDP-N-acetylglucosamine 3-dehydrogenase